MRVGDVVADRFVIEALAGAGGMGSIYRARDQSTGELVALKTIRGEDSILDERFALETRVLAELVHPAVVRYVAHGHARSGIAFLAMQWLEGETLSQRLKKGSIDLQGSLALAKRAAEGLAVAHGKGVIHRDIKPANLFLLHGDPRQTMLIDFGLAREAELSLGTKTGIILGTPGYLSPEQARGKKPIGPRADVFSLGCVLYRCLTGQPPFEGDNPVAVMAKLVFEDPPRIQDVRPDIPSAISDLVSRMMAKQPDDRPADGAEVVRALDAIAQGAPLEAARPPPKPKRASISLEEERFITVVVAARTPNDPESVPLLSPSGEPWPALASSVAPFDATLAALTDGSLVATLLGKDATLQAEKAARCALFLASRLPKHQVVVASARRASSANAALGQLIDRVMTMTRQTASQTGQAGLAGQTGQTGFPIRIDEVMAGLLDRHFEVGADATSRLLLRAREATEASPRSLPGRSSAIVGRDRELSRIAAIFEAVLRRPACRAVLVLGAEGLGKSRLRQEIIARVLAREPSTAVWTARGDPVRKGAPFSLLAELVRRSVKNPPPSALYNELVAKLSPSLGPEQAARTAQSLAIIAGAPTPSQRPGRREPSLVGENIRRAFGLLAKAELGRGPLLITLEDLQWGDLPSVQAIDLVMTQCREAPLFVLAIARPEVMEAFPRLFADHRIEEITLEPLAFSACVALARQVLGDAAPRAQVEELARRSAGNAFFLEEMLRATLEGRSGAVPLSVVAMAEARLAELDADARQLVRAASVFGTAFWTDGVHVLLGEALSERAIAQSLADLERRGIVMRSADSRFPSEDEWAFQQDAFREAAHATLTEADKALGHRLAGEWLERAGEPDAFVLAEHFALGGEALRAAAWYLEAAEQALAGNDFATAKERARLGAMAGAKGEMLGALHLAAAEAERSLGQTLAAHEHAVSAIGLLDRGGPTWLRAAAELGMTSGASGRYAELLGVVEALVRMSITSEGYASTAARLASVLFGAGRPDLAEALLARAEAQDRPSSKGEPLLHGALFAARAARAAVEGDAFAQAHLLREAVGAYMHAGAGALAMLERRELGQTLLKLGAFEEAERLVAELCSKARRIGFLSLLDECIPLLALAVLGRGAVDEAREVLAEALALADRKRSPRAEAMVWIVAGRIALTSGDLGLAERHATAALAVSGAPPSLRLHAMGLLGLVLARSRRPAEGQTITQEAMALLELQKGVDEGSSLVRLAYVEVLAALDPALASQALATSRAVLLARASRIADPALRASFLSRVPENASTLSMAEAWLG